MSAMAKAHEAINLGQGFPNFDCDIALQKLLARYTAAGNNQYAPMPGIPELRKAIADKCSMLYQKALDCDEEITITAGATQALFVAIASMISTGDEVIVFEPAYDSYRPVIKHCGGKVVPYELKAPDYKVNWNEVQELVSEKTRLIIITNPHNPCGKVLSDNDLLQLQNMVENTDINILSDEVYEHLVFDGKSHSSILKYDKLYQRCMACYSFGKTFHITGWKVGYCIAPPALTRRFRSLHQWNVFSVNSVAQYALAEYMKEASHYMKLAGFYQSKRDYFAEAMKTTGFKPLACEGSYFQLYDYSEVSTLDDVAFAEFLVEAYGVATIPVSVFYSSGRQDKVVRFCFAKTNETLSQAADRLSRLK